MYSEQSSQVSRDVAAVVPVVVERAFQFAFLLAADGVGRGQHRREHEERPRRVEEQSGAGVQERPGSSTVVGHAGDDGGRTQVSAGSSEPQPLWSPRPHSGQ